MPDPKRTYLDHAATTPLRPEAKAAMDEGFAIWANPSSPHAEGRKAREALEDARERCKKVLGWEGELIFTSGASEALAIGLGRAKAGRRVVSAIEHDAAFRAAQDVEVLPVVEGELTVEPDPQALGEILGKAGTTICAIQAVNSETGTALFPTLQNPLAETIHAAGGLLLTDCSQSCGASPPTDVDMAVYSAHKVGGPVGIGALLVRDLAMLEPTGGHERGYRAGTENLPAACGFAAALEACSIEAWQTTVEQHRDFRSELGRYGQIVAPGRTFPHVIAVASERFSAKALLIRLDSMGFAVSAGSACSSGSLKPSRVLEAFGVEPDVAKRTIRVSLGWSTTQQDLDAFADAWKAIHA